MFQIVTWNSGHKKIVKSGFHSSSQADNWAKKHLPREQVLLWSTPCNQIFKHHFIYRVQKR